MADEPIFVTGAVSYGSHRGTFTPAELSEASQPRINSGRSGCPFWAKVEELLKTGKAHSRGAAVKLAARQFPELHEMFLAAQRRQGQES